MSTFLGSKPAATKLSANRPLAPFVLAFASAPLPVSITTSLPPVLSTSGANQIVIMSRGMNAFSSAALTSSRFALGMKESSSLKTFLPSDTTVTRMSPTL
ncbi:hypothetical protein ABIF14_003727 [Bradyrhizobium elkanii]